MSLNISCASRHKSCSWQLVQRASETLSQRWSNFFLKARLLCIAAMNAALYVARAPGSSSLALMLETERSKISAIFSSGVDITGIFAALAHPPLSLDLERSADGRRALMRDPAFSKGFLRTCASPSGTGRSAWCFAGAIRSSVSLVLAPVSDLLGGSSLAVARDASCSGPLKGPSR